MTLGELTAKFWTAANFIRRHPDQPHETARTLLRQVAQYATGTLKRRTAEIMKDNENGPGSSYSG